MERNSPGQIAAHLALIRVVASTLLGRGLSRSELVQEGALVLMREIRRVDGRDARVSTSRLKGRARLGMLRAIRRKRAASANHLRLTPAREAQASAPDPFTVLWYAQLDEWVSLLLARLSAVDREILALRFGLGGDGFHTMSEASGILKVNLKCVEHRELRAIARLRRSARRLLPLLRTV